MEIAEHFFGETSANVTDCLVGFRVGVVAGEKEGTINGSALSFAVVGAEDDEVKGVAYACKVIFFDLKNLAVL